MKKWLVNIISLSMLLVSCEKEDKPMVLPPPGSLQTMTARMGVYYDDQVYVDFSTGNQTISPYRAFDLAFEAAPEGFRLYLNTAKLMFVNNTYSTDISTTDTTGHEWKTE